MLPLEKLLAPDGPLDCLLGLCYEQREREQTGPTSAKMELLFLSVCACLGVCVMCVLSCVGQAGNYDNAKVCQVATTKSVR